MAKFGKKIIEARSKVDSEKTYPLLEAIKLAQETSYTKFDGSIDLAIKLNLDTRKAEQQLRGSVTLPHGTGKKVDVLAATDDTAQTTKAKAAGAKIVVGAAELQEILKTGKFDFDIIVADPKMMPILGKFGKELGPKGLMPNPKTGTVTPLVAKAVSEIKKGKANYRTEKNGIVHVLIGKVSFDANHLVENAKTVLDIIKKLKPQVVKGVYMQNLTISPSMGPSIKIAFDSI